MKKAVLRALLLVLVLVTALGVMPQSASAAYENTHVNTGNYRQDIIAVALTQVGYRASDGYHNNKYSSYFGRNNYAWCGYFISWCAAQAGVPTSVLKRQGFASPSSFGIPSYSGNSYTPKPGDLYFHVTSSGGVDHAGLVVAVDAARGVVITVEGNTHDSSGVRGVYRKERNIKGNIFGVPNYGDGGASSHTHTYGSLSYESAHPHKAYKTCTTCGFKSYTGETQKVDGCQSCCSHTYGNWSSTGSTKHQHTCTKCGYKESKSHSWGSAKVIKEATCKEVGKKQETCSVCGATRTTDIPKAKKHTFSLWEKVDETNHQRTCTLCGTKETQAHKAGKAWHSDEEKHWHVCEICDAPMGEALHTELEYCDSACEVCKYVNPAGHTYGETFSWDENAHFRQCTSCPGITDVTPHQILPGMTADKKEHYYPCAGCDYHHDAQAHNLSEPATEERAQVCLDCGFEYAPKLPHVHFYQPMQSDWEAHWGVCQCGKVYPREEHKVSAVTGLCQVCLEVPPEKPDPTVLEWAKENALYAWEFAVEKTTHAWNFMTAEENRLYLYIACGGLALLIGGITTTVIVVKKKKKVKEPVV